MIVLIQLGRNIYKYEHIKNSVKWSESVSSDCRLQRKSTYMKAKSILNHTHENDLPYHIQWCQK